MSHCREEMVFPVAVLWKELGSENTALGAV